MVTKTLLCLEDLVSDLFQGKASVYEDLWFALQPFQILYLFLGDAPKVNDIALEGLMGIRVLLQVE
jgi:hypothetical protein